MRLTLSIKAILNCFLIVPLTSIAQIQKVSQKLFDTIKLKEHVVTLASDSFQGRKPFTVGETRTVDYLVNQLTEIGLEPANNKSYLQPVTIVQSNYVSRTIDVQSRSGSLILENPKDYAIWTHNEDTMALLKNIPVVFVGYGLVAPEYKRNDYANVNVRGKIVLLLVNEEDQAGSFLQKGKPLTRYEQTEYKIAEAARQGALAFFLIFGRNSLPFPFEMLQEHSSGETIHRDRAEPAIGGGISREAFHKLLKASDMDSNIYMNASYSDFKPIELSLNFSTSIIAKSKYKTSSNVFGKITGSKYPDDVIVYSAHWDHLGIGKPDEKGDSIYNGANDNALGVAVVLELARAFKNLKIKPARTIVFVFFTCEETRTPGSIWYVQHPVSSLKKTVANLNIDGFNRFGRTKDIVIHGTGNSTLEDDITVEVKKQGRYVSPDDPKDGFYFRSDQIRFANAGVPALFFSRGTDYINGGVAYEKTVKEKYWGYHTPNDQFNEGWRFDGTVEDMELLFNVGLRLANNRVWPQWKPQSQFRSIR